MTCEAPVSSRLESPASKSGISDIQHHGRSGQASSKLRLYAVIYHPSPWRERGMQSIEAAHEDDPRFWKLVSRSKGKRPLDLIAEARGLAQKEP